jgi:predicted NACHT family NTPase
LEAGVVTRLHDDVYTRLPHGRLVLIGEAGAGKTSAMILLLLAALDHRRSIPDTQRDQVPIPVWLTLGGWNPTTQTLQQWATATIYRDHPYLRAIDYGPDVAGELLRSGRIALFLDGLDEMATDARARALKRVETESAGLRIVLSSRPNEYRHTVTTPP